MSAGAHLSPNQFGHPITDTDAKTFRNDLAHGEVEGHSEEDYDGVKA